MAAPTIKGVQLPPDSSGKITGAFIILDPAGEVDASGATKQIIIPATVLVNSIGEDIGGEILNSLQEIAESLKVMKEYNELIHNVLSN